MIAYYRWHDSRRVLWYWHVMMAKTREEWKR